MLHLYVYSFEYVVGGNEFQGKREPPLAVVFDRLTRIWQFWLFVIRLDGQTFQSTNFDDLHRSNRDCDDIIRSIHSFLWRISTKIGFSSSICCLVCVVKLLGRINDVLLSERLFFPIQAY